MYFLISGKGGGEESVLSRRGRGFSRGEAAGDRTRCLGGEWKEGRIKLREGAV